MMRRVAYVSEHLKFVESELDLPIDAPGLYVEETRCAPPHAIRGRVSLKGAFSRVEEVNICEVF